MQLHMTYIIFLFEMVSDRSSQVEHWTYRLFCAPGKPKNLFCAPGKPKNLFCAPGKPKNLARMSKSSWDVLKASYNILTFSGWAQKDMYREIWE